MKFFRCRVCDNPLYFENSLCVSCGTSLAFSRAERAIVPVDKQGTYVDSAGLLWHVCANLNLSACTWLAPIKGIANFPAAEQAKRHLIVELDTLGFSIVTRDEDPQQGLAFDLLSSVTENVVIGHYYEHQLVRGDDLMARCRELFGDESIDYQDAIDRHYAEGPPVGWEKRYLSTYATMHPFEDFAETFAHYLHICDAIESAGEFGLTTASSIAMFSSFRDVVSGVWIPLSVALNQINRSMGKEDLYPFVIPPPVLDKLDFVAALPRGTTWD